MDVNDAKLIFRLTVSFLVLILPLLSTAQELSQKKVTLTLESTSTLAVLEQINRIDGIRLSYNPDIVKDNNLEKREYVDVSISSLLNEVLGTTYSIKYRGSYIIIQKPAQSESPKSTFNIAGAITDAKTGETIPDVTIYEINKLQSTLSDAQGNFDLTVSAKTEYVTFSISREDYQDTIIVVKDVAELKSVTLVPVTSTYSKISQRFEIETKKLVQLFTPKKSQKNAKNVRMEEERFFQFSVVPMVGTNGNLSGQIKNNLSVNLLAGYAYGLNGFEMGGFYNIIRKEAIGLQIGGFGNAVGGQSRGVQLAGFINTTKGYTTGFQAAGFFNLVTDDVKGVQAAGFVNIAKKTEGAQLAGFINLATKSMSGVQASGFVNTAKDVSGAQAAGFVNLANEMKGFQIAGFLNVAKKLKGVQLSVINIVDTVESGVPIGLFSFVRKGMHQFAFEHNDFMHVNASFRSGIPKFYSVLTAGMRFSDEMLWSYGLGFGSQFKLKNKWYGNVELTGNSINNTEREETEEDAMNLLNRLHLSVGYQAGKHLAINAGPVLNVYLTDIYDPTTGQYGDDFGQSPFYEQTYDALNLSMWVGYAVSVRF